MTRKEVLALYKKQFKRWVYMIEHFGWKLSVVYCDSYEEMPEDSTEEAVAYTRSMFRYLEASVFVNLKKSENFSEHAVEAVVIHELVHLLVSPLQEDNGVVPLEYTVTAIARVLQGLRSEHGK